MATNLRLRACSAMCLNFPRFEPEVAYKTHAYFFFLKFERQNFELKLSIVSSLDDFFVTVARNEITRM